MFNLITEAVEVEDGVINWSFKREGKRYSGQFVRGDLDYEKAIKLPFFVRKIKETVTELTLKLDAFEFKGVSCSVCESDQNGWQAIDARINTLIGRGEHFRPIPFFMENGNYVTLDTHQEWLDFVEAGWTARELILLGRLK